MIKLRETPTENELLKNRCQNIHAKVFPLATNVLVPVASSYPGLEFAILQSLSGSCFPMR